MRKVSVTFLLLLFLTEAFLLPAPTQNMKNSFPCSHEVIVNLYYVYLNPIFPSLHWLPNCFRIDFNDFKMLLTTCSPVEYHSLQLQLPLSKNITHDPHVTFLHLDLTLCPSNLPGQINVYRIRHVYLVAFFKSFLRSHFLHLCIVTSYLFPCWCPFHIYIIYLFCILYI